MSRVHEYYQDQAELFTCNKCGDEHEVYEPADFFKCRKDKKVKNLDRIVEAFTKKWNKENKK